MCCPASEGQAGVLREGAKTPLWQGRSVHPAVFLLLLWHRHSCPRSWVCLLCELCALCDLCVELSLQIQNLFVAQLPVIHPPAVPRSRANARLRTLTVCGTLAGLPRPWRRLRSGFVRRCRSRL